MLTVSAFLRKHRVGFVHTTIRRAIDEGRLTGEKLEVSAGNHESVYLVDEATLLDELRKLPTCRFEGCDQPALAGSGACSGAHARALETRGSWWESEDGERFRGLLAAGEIRPACWVCREERQMAPAFAARAWRENRRHVCGECEFLWRPALLRARWALINACATPENPLSESSCEGAKEALEVGREFETAMRRHLPARRGQPWAWRIILVSEALAAHGFGDEAARLLLDRATGTPHASRYVTILRQRSGIRRRGNGFRPAGILMH
jgi:hypothetical protein